MALFAPLIFQGSFNLVFLHRAGGGMGGGEDDKETKTQKGVMPLPSYLDKAVPEPQVIHVPVLTPASLRYSMAAL